MMSRSNIEGAAKACLSFLSSRFALEARFDERGLSVLLALVDAILEQAHEDSLPAPVAPVARHRKRSLIAKYEDEDWCSFVIEPTDGDEWVAMVTCKDDQGSGISTYLSAAQARDAGELLLQLAGAATEATPSEACARAVDPRNLPAESDRDYEELLALVTRLPPLAAVRELTRLFAAAREEGRAEGWDAAKRTAVVAWAADAEAQRPYVCLPANPFSREGA
jgi:hypothetical protein